VIGAGIGTILTAVIAGQPFVWPALAIGLGAIAATSPLVFRRSGRKYYAACGTGYCLLTAIAIKYTGVFPAGYSESPYAVILVLGVISALIVLAQYAGRRAVELIFAGRTGEEQATKIYDAVAAIAGLLAMIWTVLTIHEKALRYGGISVGGTAGLVMNAFGIDLPLPWIITDGVNAAMVAFVGALLIGFHTLESLHTTWRATKSTAKAGAAVGKKAGDKTMDAASAAADRGDDS
jgi:hypothetical protein